MKPLDKLVVLTGPNGAGKSRILDLVRRALLDDKPHNPATVASYRRKLSESHTIPENHAAGMQAVLDVVTYTTWEGEWSPGIVRDFFPKVHALLDYRSMPEAERIQSVNEVINAGGTNHLERFALAYIATVARRSFAASHPAVSDVGQAGGKAISEYARLREVVSGLLGDELSLDLDQHPMIFGRPISEAQLSQGQSILLQMAVALHAQGGSVRGLVLLLDEPECHLHPAALTQAVSRLQEVNEIGQIWLATHSVPLLASLPVDSIWYVSEGGASWAGRRPEIVLDGLLGGDNGREQVLSFLRLPAQFASNRFAAECLVPPAVAVTGPDDPQAMQLRTHLQTALPDADQAIRVLDFGAGQGRLLSALHEMWDRERFETVVDYRAYEPYPEDRVQLAGTLRAVYGDGAEVRAYYSSDELVKLDAHSVDVVVMCNVLHEVSPENWPRLFGVGGVVPHLLKPRGNLLVLEDMEIPHGEKAHRFGFLLLDQPHLYKLFRCTESDPSIETATTRRERLKAHAIPAQVLGRVSRDTVIAAIALLKATARQKVTALKQQSVDSRTGRLFALWTQLLANADLSLEALGGGGVHTE